MNTKTIVPIKIGTSCNVVNGIANEQTIRKIAKGIFELKTLGYNIIVIFSGAIGFGAPILGHKKRITDRMTRRVCAAVGQIKLTEVYSHIFAEYGLITAQVLFTYGDLKRRDTVIAIAETIAGCLEAGVVPLINYNDAVSDGELFADNDMFAAIIAGAATTTQRLLFLTCQVDGLLNKDGKLVREINADDTCLIETYKKLCVGREDMHSTGGMLSKIEAAEIMTKKKPGNSCIIGNPRFRITDLFFEKCPCTIIRRGDRA